MNKIDKSIDQIKNKIYNLTFTTLSLSIERDNILSINLSSMNLPRRSSIMVSDE